MAKFVAQKLSQNSAATVIVAGDMNVGETDKKKNGFHLGEDNDSPTARGVAPPPEPGNGGEGGSAVGDIHISELLPDPPGPDGGHEWVKLKNDGTETINLNGWKLRDKANHTVPLSGSIAAGATRTIQLGEGQMPLNNNGDKIRLLNPAGDTVHEAEYSAGQVSPGQSVSFNP